jgi:hypothetical protein
LLGTVAALTALGHAGVAADGKTPHGLALTVKCGGRRRPLQTPPFLCGVQAKSQREGQGKIERDQPASCTPLLVRLPARRHAELSDYQYKRKRLMYAVLVMLSARGAPHAMPLLAAASHHQAQVAWR